MLKGVSFSKTMRIPEKHLQRLRDKGLVVSEALMAGNCYMVGKPSTVKGNSIPDPDYEIDWGSTDVLLDAPIVSFTRKWFGWVVAVHDYIPGPGPGDFVNRHRSAERALDDILDYFFGDPTRMEMAARAPKRTPRALL